MLKLIHRKSSTSGKYYTALTATDTKAPLCFDAIPVRLALTLAEEKANDLCQRLKLPYISLLLQVEEPWELDIN